MSGHHHHPHGHRHGHSHRARERSFGKAFLIGIVLNSLFILAEVAYGLKANSLALLADAGHNLSDVAGLVLAWGATVLGRRLPSERFTYGLRSSTIIAALANGVLLLVAVGGILWEALQRLAVPEPMEGPTVMIVAAIGVVINGFTAWLFTGGHKHDLNIRGAYLHMAADAAISLGVVVTGAAAMATGWMWLDPVVSVAIVLIIVHGTWGLLRDSTKLALHAVPDRIRLSEVRDFLRGQQGVEDVHDLHVWAMSTTEAALTAHLLMPCGHPGDGALQAIIAELEARFGIHHATLQIEIGDGGIPCRLAPHDVI